MTASTGEMVIRAAMGARVNWREAFDPGACVICGCTQDRGCPEGCSWIINPREELFELRHGLCDLCLDRVLILLETPPDEWAGTVADSICRHAPINTLVLAAHLARGRCRREIIRKSLDERMRALPDRRPPATGPNND